MDARERELRPRTQPTDAMHVENQHQDDQEHN